MIAIKTYKRRGVRQYENPQIKAFGVFLEELSAKHGLQYRNISNRIFEILLKGKGKKSLGFVTHCDTVPANEEIWIVNDRKIDPYSLNKIDGRLYGRGVLDDKGSIAAAFFALKALKESGVYTGSTIRLIIETTEETSGSGLAFYKKKNRLPNLNVVLDDKYPVVVGEKGFGSILTVFKKKKYKRKCLEIIKITGSSAINIIPLRAEATLKSRNSSSIISKVKKMAGMFVDKRGGDFTIDVSQDNEKIIIIVEGKSAHSSEPWFAVNPVSRICVFLSELSRSVPMSRNGFYEAVVYVNDNYGMNDYGKKLNIKYTDEKMGPLSAVVTTIDKARDSVKVGVNLRIPHGIAIESLKSSIRKRLHAYSKKQKIKMKYRVFANSYFSSGVGKDVQKILLDVYRGVTGNSEAGTVYSAASTSARMLPNSISFGPCHPGRKCMIHIENEYIKEEDLLLNFQMITEVAAAIGQKL